MQKYPEAERIKEDVASIKDNAVQLGHRVKDQGAEKAQQVKEAVVEGYNRFKETGSDQMKEVERRVREKPIQSLAIAFGVGLVASLLFGRR